jgi:hypothetical protein
MGVLASESAVDILRDSSDGLRYRGNVRENTVD